LDGLDVWAALEWRGLPSCFRSVSNMFLWIMHGFACIFSWSNAMCCSDWLHHFLLPFDCCLWSFPGQRGGSFHGQRGGLPLVTFICSAVSVFPLVMAPLHVLHGSPPWNSVLCFNGVN
jgi:hypothetical protein